AYDTAKRILTEKRPQLDALAQGLLEFETLSGEEMKGILDGKKPSRENLLSPPSQTPPSASVPSSGEKTDLGISGLEPHPV
ncbi:MAG: cell division protein FtsH, partial [Methylocystis sp.]